MRITIKNWTEEQVSTLRTMIAAGKSSREIGLAVGKTSSAVRRVVAIHKENLQLIRPPIRGRPRDDERFNKTEFDKAWYGSVPYLHWTITKAWK